MVFGNEEKTNYVSVCFYPARDYETLAEFGAIRRAGSKSLIVSDKQVDTLAGCLPAIRDSMCVGGERVIIKCESGNFRLHTPRSHGSARLYLGAQYIILKQPDMDYWVRVFHIIQQHLRDFIFSLPDVLSYVIISLTSVSYIETMPKASKNIDYPHIIRKS